MGREHITAWRGKPKLSTEQRDAASRMRAEGATLKAIGARFGISEAHAHRITKGIASYRYKVAEYDGEKRSLREWALLTGISYSALQQRLARGWAIDRAMTKDWRQRRPPRTVKVVEYNGEQRSLREWALLTGISYSALHQRLARGWAIERMMTKVRQARTPRVTTAQNEGRMNRGVAL